MLNLYNTLSRRVEPFRPQGKTVTMYTCGPTVHDFVHIGNLRAFVFYDTVKRVLTFNGYRVKHVMNVTDIDDKVIRNARKAKLSPEQLAEKYERAYVDDLKKLHIIPADKSPKATEYIPAMAALIQRLLDKKVAYTAKDGSIYFSIKKFPHYGKLARLQQQKLQAGARVAADEYSKDAVQDFALWKAAQPGEPSWDAPFGKGRPGWHIECSAMSLELLGETIDIHAGGSDLIFPHHENEIAQSEAATGKLFVRYWLHNEHLLVDGKKMSKSLHNFYTLRDVEKKTFDPIALRYLFLTARYREPLNFTWKALASAQQALDRLVDLVQTWDKPAVGCAAYEGRFSRALNDDLGTPQALAVMWELVRDDQYPSSAKHASLLKMDQVLGLGLDAIEPMTLTPEEKKLLQEREKAREAKDFATSDAIRARLEKMGLVLEDTAHGTRIKRKRS